MLYICIGMQNEVTIKVIIAVAIFMYVFFMGMLMYLFLRYIRNADLTNKSLKKSYILGLFNGVAWVLFCVGFAPYIKKAFIAYDQYYILIRALTAFTLVIIGIIAGGEFTKWAIGDQHPEPDEEE